MKRLIPYPTIDLPATGLNIIRLRKLRGLSVQDLQRFFGFESPAAIYQWQRGDCLPSVDNLYALSAILQVSMNDILVPFTLDRKKDPPPVSGGSPALSRRLFCMLPFGFAA